MNSPRRFAATAIAALSAATLIAGCAGSDQGSTGAGLASGRGDNYYSTGQDSGAIPGAEYPEPVTGQELVENDWVDVAEQPVSTFSSDVDTASYTMIRSLLNSGDWNEGMRDQVRIEEMLNYFDYAYEAPGQDSERPFNVDVKLGAAPWDAGHMLARIGVKAKEAWPTTEGNNLVLLLDTSGSMDQADKLPLLVKSFKLLTERLTDRDRISVVTYAGTYTVALEGVRGTETDLIVETLESLHSAGSTAGSDALAQAYRLAEDHFIEGGNNRILLATDGDFNVGPSSTDALKEQITQARDNGVFISVFGFGMHNHDALMETIADNGNGNYFYIDNLNEAERALVRQFDATMFTVAKDLKLQVAFNPARVARYRLVGYENRVLQNEDFEDDSVDAGDVGAGATVTALYELIPADGPKDGDDWMTVSTRYKDPAGTESKQDDFPVPQSGADGARDKDWRWAAAVAEFGMILRDSPFKADASLGEVKALAEDSLGEDLFGLRAEFLALVDRYERTL
ncbi:MAG: von Willebrand factor type A domain-containing protein [Bifidobacteriaceae bacterium]|jgi:Ca-activated chloride channel family protein|nr:von Willebrand factor type A domain-containing protein [Bifidobacteriaceae bacterium]